MSTDVLLTDWQRSGFRAASTVSLSRLDCLEHSLLIFRLGRVAKPDARRLERRRGRTHQPPVLIHPLTLPPCHPLVRQAQHIGLRHSLPALVGRLARLALSGWA